MSTPTYAGYSDVGRKRSRNDDRWGVDPALRLYVVADGVGSTSHGDLAAALVVEMLPSYVARYLGGADLRDGQAPAQLGHAMVEMCNDLYARSRTDSQLDSADTTAVAAVITDSRAVIAHLGDSRAYLYRDRRVRRLTSDHTIVQAVIDAGEISVEEAANHPSRSVVTRHVLMTPPARPDVSGLDLQPGDRILLCSDGLHGVIDDATLAVILTEYRDPQDACRALTAAANQAGGPDNITAVVVDVGHVSPPSPPGSPPTLVDYAPPPRPGPTLPEAAVPPISVPGPQQWPADPSLAVTQQRLPDWPTVPPAPPPGPPPPQIEAPLPQPSPPRRRRGLKVAVVAAVIVAVVAAATTGYLLWQRMRTSQTPSGQTTPSSGQVAQPTSPPRPTELVVPGLTHPEGVAVDTAGNIYVVANDGAKPQVLKLAAGSGAPSPLPFTDFKGPYGVAVDTGGNVYVTNVDGGRVAELPAGSDTPIVLPFTGLSKPTGVAVDTSGNVYVADGCGGRVVELEAGSNHSNVLRVAGCARSVAVDSAGNLYVADDYRGGQVVKRAVGSLDWTVLPFTGLVNPTGMAVDTAGNVYVADGYSNGRVLKLAAGSGTPNPPLHFDGLGNPVGVAVDAAGGVYVSDYSNDKLWKLAAG
jgi:PPM family protein phosphatase